MAGYIFAVSKDMWTTVCEENICKGFFTPYTLEVSEDKMTSRSRKSINKILAAFFGDMVTMKEGDNIYFLSDRKIYGIGKAHNIGNDCKYDNYSEASALLPNCQIKPTDFLTTADSKARWVFFFKPSPYFYKIGVDMDDVLRYRPSAFKVLRAFEGLSFVKIDDEENRALKEYISLINEESHANINNYTFPFDDSVHNLMYLKNLSQYEMDINKVFSYTENIEYVESEMFIEAAFLQAIMKNQCNAIGQFDYVTQQLIASPFKPIRYIDKIDVFGYKFSTNYTDKPRLITKYILVELKKDKINKETLEQAMQYVDWICKEYASGDYSRVDAYVLGNGVGRGLTGEIFTDICQRSYIASTHPAKPEKWNNLKKIKYSIDDNKVIFSQIE